MSFYSIVEQWDEAPLLVGPFEDPLVAEAFIDRINSVTDEVEQWGDNYHNHMREAVQALTPSAFKRLVDADLARVKAGTFQ